MSDFEKINDLVKNYYLSFIGVKDPYTAHKLFYETDEILKDTTAYVSMINFLNPKWLLEWNTLNIRDNKDTLTNRTYKEIMLSLKKDPNKFCLRNKGVTMSVGELKIESNDKLYFAFANNALHGVFDGGHTILIINNYLWEGMDYVLNTLYNENLIKWSDLGIQDAELTAYLKLLTTNTDSEYILQKRAEVYENLLKFVSLEKIRDVFKTLVNIPGHANYATEMDYIHVELIQNIKMLNTLKELVQARNTGIQVDDKTLAGFSHYFDGLMNILRDNQNQLPDQNLVSRVHYKQGEPKRYTDIDVKNVLNLLAGTVPGAVPNYFNRAETYNALIHDLKNKIQEDGLDPAKYYDKYAIFLVQQINLYDAIEKDLATNQKFLKYFKDLAGEKAVQKSGPSTFANASLPVKIPSHYVYGVMTFLKSLIAKTTIQSDYMLKTIYKYATDPIAFYQAYKNVILSVLLDRILKTNTSIAKVSKYNAYLMQYVGKKINEENITTVEQVKQHWKNWKSEAKKYTQTK